MVLRRSLPAVVIFVLAVSAVAFAQQTQTPGSESETRPERMHEGRGRRHNKMGRNGFGGFRGMRELNLSETQREQQRAIIQRHLESIKAQREELFKLREKRMAGTFTADDEASAKALREEIHASRQRIHTEIENILTPEQRAKLEQLKTEQKALHEGTIKRRRERQESIPQ